MKHTTVHCICFCNTQIVDKPYSKNSVLKSWVVQEQKNIYTCVQSVVGSACFLRAPTILASVAYARECKHSRLKIHK